MTPMASRSRLISRADAGCEISYRPIGPAEALMQKVAGLGECWMERAGEFALNLHIA